MEMAKELATETDIALGCDGSITFFYRSGFERHSSYRDRIESLRIDDLADKSAQGYMVV